MTLRGLWKRAKGYGRITASRKRPRRSAKEDPRNRRRDPQGYRGRAEPIMLYLALLRKLRKPSEL